MAEQQRGYIVPVGGAEEKIGDVAILRRFAALCGGESVPDRHHPHRVGAERDRRPLRGAVPQLGVSRGAASLPIASRADCERREWLDVLDQVDGIFLTGGNQLRLSTMIGGTAGRQGDPAAERGGRARGRHLRRRGIPLRAHDRVRQGGRVAPGQDRDAWRPGLGLTNRIIIDQHFRQRDRLGRLLTALAYNPFAIGIGLDEDTAAFIGPDETLEVVGGGALTIVDRVGSSSSPRWPRSARTSRSA